MCQLPKLKNGGTPDWINGYVGGHFHPTNPREMNKKELKSFLIEACRKTLEA